MLRCTNGPFQPKKGAPKVGPKAAHLRGYINRGRGRLRTLAFLLFTGTVHVNYNAGVNSSRVALQCRPSFAPKPYVTFADLAVWIATLLPVRVDTLEVPHLLHKDEPHERKFSQPHCRLPSALHRRATEVPQPHV